MQRMLPVLLMSIVMVSCVTAASTRVGGVRIETNVPAATLLVDEEIRGPVQAYERHYVRLSPGPHRLMLEHSDYFTEYIDIDVVENMGMAVRLEMRRRPSD
jgi:hypothetical protein